MLTTEDEDPQTWGYRAICPPKFMNWDLFVYMSPLTLFSFIF
jgi:hypothetical protein